MALLCGKKKPLTTSIVDMGHDDSGHGDDCSDLDGVENQVLLEPTRPNMEHLTLLMNRAKKGFGFTVTGGNPVRVGRVEEGSPALQVGLKSNDCIIRINGQNVVRLDVDKVAKIVKQCDKQVVMDVHRYYRNTTSQGVSTDRRFMDLDDTFSESSYSSSGFGSGSHPHLPNTKKTGLPNWVPVDKMPKVSPWQLYHQLKEQQAQALFDDCESEYSYYTETESCYSCYTCTTEESSDDSQRGHSRSPPNKVCKFCEEDEARRMNPAIMKYTNTTTTNKTCDNPALDKENMAPKLPPKTFSKRGVSGLANLVNPPPPRPARVSSRSKDRSSDESSVVSSHVSRFTVRYHELSEDELNRQKAMHQLFQCENQFHREIQRGIQVFCRPLRQNIVSPQQHAILFQNIEKLCALSEQLIAMIKENRVGYSDVVSQTEQYIPSIGSVYTSMLEDLCESYEMYCSGVCDSVKLLTELKSYKDFGKYIKKISAENENLNLGKFIQRPVEHVKNLTLHMQKVFKNTPSANPDSEELQDMITALRRTSTNITQEYVRRSRSNLTSIASRSSVCSSSVSSEKDSTTASVSSIDSEVQDIQNRLLFGDSVKSFQLTNATRHLIYAGELLYQTRENWVKVHAILMNDLLLLTKQSSDNFLHVLDTPIILQDVRRCESGTNHPSEITLTVDCQHWETLGYEPRLYNFRGTSIEQKCVWKNLLDQKISSCKAQKELTVSKVAELV